MGKQRESLGAGEGGWLPLAAAERLLFLDLSGNCLAALPPPVLAFSALTTLRLAHNERITVPPPLSATTSFINVACRYQSLPNELGALDRLEELDIDGLDLKSLPDRLNPSLLHSIS